MQVLPLSASRERRETCSNAGNARRGHQSAMPLPSKWAPVAWQVMECTECTMLHHQLPLFGVKSVCQGLMVDQSDISRPYHCPNPLACPGGLLLANGSTPMCTKGQVKKKHEETVPTQQDRPSQLLDSTFPAAVFQNDIWSFWTAWMKPDHLPMAIEGKAWPNEFLHAGYQGIGCNTCATDFARTDSNIFICTECVAWLPIRFSWHKPTKSAEIYRSVPACLNMKSRRLVERTVPTTHRLELVSRGTPIPDLATNTQTLQAAVVVVLGRYKLRQKTSFGKSRRRSCLSVATPPSLPFRPFLVSRGGLTCCHAGLLGHRPCAAPRLASSPHNDGTKRATCKLGKTQALRPVASCSPCESVEI